MIVDFATDQRLSVATKMANGTKVAVLRSAMLLRPVRNPDCRWTSPAAPYVMRR